MMDQELLSAEALQWLSSVNYRDKPHEERIALIKAAKIAYPSKEEDMDPTSQFFMTLFLR